MRLVSVLCILSLLAVGLCSTALADKNAKFQEPLWHWNHNGARATFGETEPNNTCPGNQMQCGDVIDPAEINPVGDHDWFTFTANAGDLLTIATNDANDCDLHVGVGDTYLYLYAADCNTILAQDDDSGPGFYSLIQFTATYTGVYNVMVKSYGDYYTGCYTLSVTCGAVPTGACCFADGHCTILNQIDCGNQGGVYQGNNTVCNPNPCPQPPPPDGNDLCSGAVVLERCTAGSLTGNTTPDHNDYDPGSGGCSSGYPERGNDVTYKVDLQAGDTVDMTYTQLNLDGAFYVVTDCSNVPGTCVIGADNTVTGQPETIHWNVANTGTYYIILDSYTTGGGPWTWDYTFTCPAPQACCFPDGSCQMLLPGDCSAQGGVPQGVGSSCSPNPCHVVPVKASTWGQIKANYK